MKYIIGWHPDVVSSTIYNDLQPQQFKLLQSIAAYTSSNQEYTIPLQHFTECFGSEISTMNELKPVVDALLDQLGRSSYFDAISGTEDVFYLFSHVRFDYDAEKVTFTLNEKLEYILRGRSEREQLLDISYEGISGMPLKTAKFLYMSFSAGKLLGEARVSVGSLRFSLRIPETVSAGMIRKNYILPALEYLQAYFGNIDMRVVKKGRHISTFVFTFMAQEHLPGFDTVLEMRNYPKLKEYVDSRQYARDRLIAIKLAGEANAEEFLVYNYKEMIDDAVKKGKPDYNPAQQSDSYRKKAMELHISGYKADMQFEEKKSETKSASEDKTYRDWFEDAGCKCGCGYPLYRIKRKSDGQVFIGHPDEQQDEIEIDTGVRCTRTFSSPQAARNAVLLESRRTKEKEKKEKEEAKDKAVPPDLVKDYLAYISEKYKRQRETRIAEIRQSDPRYAEYENILAQATRVMACSIMAIGDSKTRLTTELADIREGAQKLLEDILRDAGKPADYLEMVYTCTYCKDTGSETESGARCRHWDEHADRAVQWGGK